MRKKIPLAVRVADDGGQVLGGASAKTFGNWLLIENIWIGETLRGKGLGSEVLRQLEDGARARGCQYALLDTLDFQARPFYERFGYRLAFQQDHYPRAGVKYWMVKKLS